MQNLKCLAFILVLILSTLSVTAQKKFTLDSTVLVARTVIDGIDIPWEITWGPDNYIWTTERYGRVSRINPVDGQQHVILDISSVVYDNSESGLLGLALHPEFETNPYVYLVYTYLSGSNILERLVRYTYDGSKLGDPLILLDNITGNTTHIGSRLFILPDKTMLMSTGDAQNQLAPQDQSSLVGKILRMNLDGSIPADNPDPQSLVWSFGHRNTQGIWQAPNGLIYISEHGPTSDDELSILLPNRNYGWPTVTGYCNTPPEINFCNNNNVVEPIAAWTPTIAPSDIIWYNHTAIPEFNNRLLMTVLKDQELISFKFNESGETVVSEKSYFKYALGRLRDICVSPNGKIYLATNGDSWANTNPFSHSIVELSKDSIATAIHHAAANNEVKMWPNPIITDEVLHLNLRAGEGAKISICDLLGQVILTQTLNGNAQIPLTIPKGSYILNIHFANGNINTKKLIVH